jgi:hypothetical protein
MLRTPTSRARTHEDEHDSSTGSSRFGVPVPRAILVAEARSVLHLFREHWEPLLSAKGECIHRGFGSVGAAHLPRSTADELEALVARMDQEDRSLVAFGRSHVRARTKAGLALVAELGGVSRAACPPGLDREKASAVKELGRLHSGASSAREVASALFAYSDFLRNNGALVAGFGGFDLATLEVAAELGRELSAYAAPSLRAREEALFSQRPDTARSTYVVLRKIRHYAKYLFRDRPEMYRQFTSVYLRAQRARLRRLAKSANEH